MPSIEQIIREEEENYTLNGILIESKYDSEHER